MDRTDSDSASSRAPSDSSSDAATPSLLHLAAHTVAAHAAIEGIASIYELLPYQVRVHLIQQLHDDRLRLLELTLSSSETATPSQLPFTVACDEAAFQAEWKHRCHLHGIHVDHTISAETLFRDTRPPRNARMVYWEHRFRSVLQQEQLLMQDGEGPLTEQSPIELYQDVVHTLKANGRELVPRNTARMLQLPALRRLELHNLAAPLHPSVLGCLEAVLRQSPSLEELCFFHCRVSAALINSVAALISERRDGSQCGEAVCPIRVIEFVSVKLKTKADHRALVSLCGAQAQELVSVRLSSTITDFENQPLVRSLFASPRLERLSLEHNDLEDDSFTGLLTKSDATSNVSHLHLGSSSISVPTMRVLSSASLDGRLNLKSLELRNNQEIRGDGILALSPMLTVASSRLTLLDVRNCHFGLDGAVTLLSSLADNRTLLSLDMSQNFLGSGFGDVLSEFLLTNVTLEKLFISYVGLGLAGCTQRLLTALRTNTTLRVLAIGANRLRNEGALAIVQAVAVRGMVMPFEALDLSGNLLTAESVRDMAELVHRLMIKDDDEDRPLPKRRRLNVEQSTAKLIDELGLLNILYVGPNGETSSLDSDALDQLGEYIGKIHCDARLHSRSSAYDDEV